MEIVTCVLSGSLEHEDDRGGKGVLVAGDIQVLSAGSGIAHAERNPSAGQPLHLAQIWLTPWRRGGDPRYAQKSVTAEARRGKLAAVVSRESKIAGTLPIHQDAFIYLGDIGAGESVTHELRQARHAYVFLAEGEGSVSGVAMAAGDAARVHEEERIVLGGGPGGRFLLIDMV
jgi:redox-sensitive bicupin YhaK (pirin superfamily)